VDDGSTLGDHLKRVRKEHGFTQEGLAEKAGLSADTIRKLEQGRRTSARMSTLMQLANALDVDLTELTGKRERLGSDRDGGSVLAIRDAILSPSLIPGMPGLDPDDDAPTPLPELEAIIAAGWQQYWQGDFGPLTAMTPGLINEARLTYRSVGAEAVGALAQSFQLAACLLLHLGKTDLAAMGAERGIAAAAGGDDEWQWAVLVSTLAWVLMNQGRLAESENLAVRVAEQIEPSFSAPVPHLVSWGNLLVAAIDTAAIAQRDVTTYVSMASAGAERIGRLVNAYQTTFGSSKVAVNATHAYVMGRETSLALAEAKKVRVGDLPRIAYGHHLLDLAQTHVDARQSRAAEVRLAEAHSLSPVWFRHQHLAVSLVAETRAAQTRPSPTIRMLARAVGLAQDAAP
jgi:transcriptional regulator with XRE-family HTH domain